MNIKLKDIFKLIPKDEYINLCVSGSIFGEDHVAGKALVFQTYFPELGDRYVERLYTCEGDLSICLLPSEGVRS